MKILIEHKIITRMKTILFGRIQIVFAILFSLNSLIVNSGNVEELKTNLQNTSGIEKVDLLNELAVAVWNRDREEAFNYAEQAWLIAKETGYEHGRATAIKNMGVVKFFTGDYEEAKKYYNQAYSIFDSLEDRKGMGACKHNLAYIYKLQGDYSLALNLYQESIQIDMELGDEEGVALTYHNLGDLYYYLAEYDTALCYFEKALPLYEKLEDTVRIIKAIVNIAAVHEKNDDFQFSIKENRNALEMAKESVNKRMEGLCLNNLGANFINLNELDEAFDYLIRAILIRDEIDDKKGMMESLKLIGQAFELKGLHDKAIDYYFQSLKFSEEMNDKRNTSEIFTLIGISLTYKKLYSDAIQYFMQSLEIAEDIGARAEVLENYHQLAMVWSSRNNYDSASFYIQKYALLFDSISGKKVPVEFLEEKVLQSGKSPLEKKIHNYRIIILIGSILLFILAVILVVVWRRK